MFRNTKDRRILGNYKETKLEELKETLLTKLGLFLTKLRVLLLKNAVILRDNVTVNLETLKHNIIVRLNQRNELKHAEREAYRDELSSVRAARYEKAIETAKERGKQKAHGKKRKARPKLTVEQLKAIETRRKQLGQLGKNLSSSVLGNTSMQPRKKKKTTEDLKAEIEKVKLENQLVELKKKPKTKGAHKGVQVGINPLLFSGGQNNALDNVLSFMGVQSKKKKNGR